ncbi:MAG TPA: amidohydrolase [Actinomycetales bacterium]|nr:amidohydrolase [Actinomycetales bacterium]
MTEFADLVITGADVWTADAARSWSDAVAVRGDRILALGAARVADLVGPRTRVEHRPGAMVVPGFQDAHVHTPFAGRNLLHVWLNDLEGRPAYLDRISHYAADNPDQPWIIGGGWAMEHFPGGTPRKEDLDAIVPDRPVFLMNRDVHGAWASSKALELAGITKDTPDPPDGRIERDPETGEPTGTLHEGAAYSFQDRYLPLPSHEDWERATLEGQRHLHSLGITGWQDAWVTPATVRSYRSLAADGRLTGRVVGALWWDRHRELDQIPELLAQREAGTVEAPGSAGFHPTSVKIMTDGVLENFTGALLEPYCDGCGGHTDNHGLSYVERDLLAAAVTELDRLGFQVHMHAIGDRAVRNALDAVQAARVANGPSDHRHHIAHIQVVQHEDVPRFRELGVVANAQAYWAQAEPQMEELTIPFLGRDRAQLQYPFGDLLRSGATLAMGSDWSVTTANPLEEIEVAVTRVDPENRDNAPFLPEQALPLQVALAAFTAGSAYVNHDHDGGSLAIGKRADLAVVDRNLFDVPSGHVADARVELTVASGRVVHERGQ